MDNPSPVPPYCRVDDPSACVRLRKSLFVSRPECDAGVGHRKTQRDSRAVCVSFRTCTTISPWLMNLMALPIRFTTTWVTRYGIADEPLRTSGRVADSSNLFVGRARPRLEGLIQRLPQIELDGFEL